MQWNLNIQRQVTPSVSAIVGYVGSRGVHQPFRSHDADVVRPSLTRAGYLWPSPVGSGTTIDPNFGQNSSFGVERKFLLSCFAIGRTEQSDWWSAPEWFFYMEQEH